MGGIRGEPDFYVTHPPVELYPHELRGARPRVPEEVREEQRTYRCRTVNIKPRNYAYRVPDDPMEAERFREKHWNETRAPPLWVPLP